MTKYYLKNVSEIAREYWQLDDEDKIFSRKSTYGTHSTGKSGNKLRDSPVREVRELYSAMEILVTEAVANRATTPVGVAKIIESLPFEKVTPVLEVNDHILRKYLPQGIYSALQSRRRSTK